MNLEQLKMYEKVKLSYLRNMGDTLAVSKELNLSLDYIKKMVKKIKGRELQDHQVLIANNLTQQILLGYKQRESYYLDLLKKLDNKEFHYVSNCCTHFYRLTELQDDPDKIKDKNYVCLKCGRGCDLIELPRNALVDTKLNILKDMRDNDRHLVSFAEKMGYTKREDPVPTTINKTTQNILVMNKGSMSEEDQKVILDIENLSGMDRELLRKELEQKISKEGDEGDEG